MLDRSCRSLAPEPRRVLRLLGSAGHREVTASAVAKLAEVSEDRAREHLAALAAVHLVEAVDPDRVAVSSLIRAYVAEAPSVG